MHALRLGVDVAWAVFWVYWLASAVGVKEGGGGRGRRFPLTGLTVVAVFLLVRVFRSGGLAVHSLAVGAVGALVFACGLGLAVWARVHLGRNWGMPMTEKTEPELVTSGPYRFVRHPIYSGLLFGIIGTALVTNLISLLIAAIFGAYLYYCATVEERYLTAAFPATYPAYRRETKMLIPFVL